MRKMTMRIPNEFISSYFVEIDRKTTSEGRKTEPIEASTRLGGSLSTALPKQQRAPEDSEAAAGQSHAKRQGHRKNHAILASKERRQNERRKQKLPVLLDTRLTRHRRESGRDSTIDFEI
jgi:hypothetical protein